MRHWCGFGMLGGSAPPVNSGPARSGRAKTRPGRGKNRSGRPKTRLGRDSARSGEGSARAGSLKRAYFLAGGGMYSSFLQAFLPTGAAGSAAFPGGMGNPARQGRAWEFRSLCNDVAKSNDHNRPEPVPMDIELTEPEKIRVPGGGDSGVGIVSWWSLCANRIGYDLVRPWFGR
uniref:Uncharacterized protein n=1 Tax=Candidatus Kentrum eta TaxID=2126337 RepID=A0A450UVD4_9GAMM|nr:MAG: hypothetical protein BECKH772A_GA0070896_1000716 [Candidatus Kentron sp. H]VFJ90157.1 MAG: hypothetical protein BECKH772B_GA0070898_1000816 [Candidatus Kentron sp. H]VFJ96521.1 MAG: hypothetical protein BECKH772C_GA0070978_1000716 [Candidatus Kentron sp. H]